MKKKMEKIQTFKNPRTPLPRTQMRLLVWYTIKEDNKPYTDFEMENKMNFKSIPSFDYEPSADNKTRTDHKLAYLKLLSRVKAWHGRISKAHLLLMDWVNLKEHRIAEFPDGDYRTGNRIEPVFTRANERGHVYIDFLPLEPFKTDDIRLEYYVPANPKFNWQPIKITTL